MLCADRTIRQFRKRLASTIAPKVFVGMLNTMFTLLEHNLLTTVPWNDRKSSRFQHRAIARCVKHARSAPPC